MKWMIFAGTLFASTSAFAIDLSVNQNQPIFMPDGKTSKMACEAQAEDGKCTHWTPMTLGFLIQKALTDPLVSPDGRSADPTNARAGALAGSLYGKDSTEIKIDDLHIILERADRLFLDPVMLARLHGFLDPAKKEADK